MRKVSKLLGQILLEHGTITQEQLDAALYKQQTSMGHRRIGEILLRLGLISKSHITEALADQLGIPIIKISDREIPERICKQIPRMTAILYRVVPIEEAGPVLVVATADPTNIDFLNTIQRLTERPLDPVLATPEEIALALYKYYGLEDRGFGGGACLSV